MTEKTGFGEMNIDVPCDHKGKFEPHLVKKQQIGLSGNIEKILSIYIKGMTARNIGSNVRKIYEINVSDSIVSRITD